MMKTDRTVIIIGTNTAALRASRILRSHGIPSKAVRKTVPGARGCVYGLEIHVADYHSAIYVLDENGINYSFMNY
ncbi:MAG: DUF3343 domain-containing protein [Clostridiales bacterium]|nr:DUF3343 domain-containing protein [Clostridiales bacterium]